jgi:hypothetical protein
MALSHVKDNTTVPPLLYQQGTKTNKQKNTVSTTHSPNFHPSRSTMTKAEPPTTSTTTTTVAGGDVSTVLSEVPPKSEDLKASSRAGKSYRHTFAVHTKLAPSPLSKEAPPESYRGFVNLGSKSSMCWCKRVVCVLLSVGVCVLLREKKSQKKNDNCMWNEDVLTMAHYLLLLFGAFFFLGCMYEWLCEVVRNILDNC